MTRTFPSPDPSAKGSSNNQSSELVPRVVRIGEACRLLGVGRSTVYRLINEGRIRPIKLYKRTLIPISEINGVLLQGAPAPKIR